MVIKVGLNPIWPCPYTKGTFEPEDRHRENTYDDDDRDNAATSKGMPRTASKPPEATRGTNSLSLSSNGQHLDLRLPASTPMRQ